MPTLVRSAIASLLLIATVSPASGQLKNDNATIVVESGAQAGTFDVLLKLQLALLTDLSAPTSAPQTFRLDVDGVPVSTVTVPVNIDPGSGPSFCAPPACAGTCGTITIDGQPYSLICDPDDCECLTPVITTTLATSVPLSFPNEICVVQPPEVPGGPEIDLGCHVWGSINRRILDVQVQPQVAPADPSLYEVIVDVGIDVGASSTLPLDLLANPIVTVDCEELNPDDCGACCGEACDCGCSVCADTVVTEMVALSLVPLDPLAISPSCGSGGPTECGSASFADGETRPLECDPENDRCTLATGRHTYSNITLESGARIVVHMDYTGTSLPELYDDGDVLDFVYDPLVSAPPEAVGGLGLSVAPNPFNPSTQVTFTAVAGAGAVVRVFEGHGRLVETLFEGRATGAEQTITWRARDVPSGVYFVKIESRGEEATEKVVLLK